MHRLRILVADDEARMQAYYRTVLDAAGHEVVGAACTGRDLVAQCGQLKPDLVISDIKMPDMDGIEAAEQIYRTSAIPVILVSAHHDQDLIDRALANHVMAYLIKPIKQADLEPAIAIALRRFEEFEAMRKETADLRAGAHRPQGHRASQARLDGNGSPGRAVGISPLAKAGQRKESQADRHRPYGAHCPRSDAPPPLATFSACRDLTSPKRQRGTSGAVASVGHAIPHSGNTELHRHPPAVGTRRGGRRGGK